MGKVKNSPVAARTRSKKQNVIQKKKIQFIDCKVKLVRLTNEQIMVATSSGLAKIEKKTLDEPKYGLRIRPPKMEKNQRLRKVTEAVATLCSPADMTAAKLWIFLKKENSSLPVKDHCCLAKMKSYSPWPALILDNIGKRTQVFFFGEGTTGTVASSEIVPFEKCGILIKKYLNIKGYTRTVRQLELTQNIPQHLSILNDF